MSAAAFASSAREQGYVSDHLIYAKETIGPLRRRQRSVEGSTPQTATEIIEQDKAITFQSQ